MPDAQELDTVLAAPLRGENVQWPAGWANEEHVEAARRRLAFHGIAGLLNDRVEFLIELPASLRTWLRDQSVKQLVWEAAHKEILSSLLGDMKRAGIECRVLKGTAIAYACYEVPSQRMRSDSDLLVSKSDLRLAREVLHDRQFERLHETEGPFGNMHYQEVWRTSDKAGLLHDIDLHWEVTNTRALRSILDVEAFLREGVPLTNLAPEAVTVSTETRLIHGFVNRAAHGPFYASDEIIRDTNRLIWANDFGIQMEELSENAWERLAERCCSLGIAGIAIDAMRFAKRRVGTAIPEMIMDELRLAPQQTHISQYIYKSGPLGRGLEDFRASEGFSGKASYILARVFPAPAYMRSKYRDLQNLPLPILYVLRPLIVLRKLVKD